ncbi:LacI family transcriptional regulator [Actinopolymorpha cephalotaxi]|uniref:LacI family transcriptional regulator n=1 Tax=Actinopolymorpha cephalotaxi TaxID=504797 RepID=A0A1I2PI11_9ACTN|nr:LacI family DNA-binding transcriptional regulator [Actinopolymorpha cephalotaxi]NYH83680.1 LacI family transcriptional regulator [Actinopolymorpha cephalotaxi]SFG13276.1 LacI family transcriptional regulator [Actinopolymorpha cephalotaxi]
MGKGSTLHEIARDAGVSIATVSRVARGVGQVSPATRMKVQEAIDRHNFRPSHFGRALVNRRHGALGIVFPGLSGPYYSDVINGFEEEAVNAQVSVHIMGTHFLRQSVDMVLDMADRVDGIAVMGDVIPEDAVRRLTDRGERVVLLAGGPLVGVPTIRTENLAAMARLTTHLLSDHGYERLVFVGNPDGSSDTTYRWQGFLQAHRRLGADPPGEPIRVGLAQSNGFIAVSRLLDQKELPDAIVCANDEIALGAVVALMDRGLRVPQDLAVTGFDDISMAGLAASGLTTVHQPMRELGAETARQLLRHVEGDLDVSLDRVLETQVVIRGSCGCGVESPATK